jgi:hypothetical protein
MTKEEKNRTGHDLLYLAACALHGSTPDAEVVSGMDLRSLYQLCQFHSLTAIVCMALEGTPAFEQASPELKKKWRDARDKAIRKNMMLDAERTKLFAWMEENGIWYMPMKGILLKELYPKAGMRQMSDNDILYDADYQMEVMDYMVAHGYEAINVGKSNHDEYEKPPIYNFELHTALFGEAHDPLWQSYYADVKNRLLKDEGNAFGYHFREEDFYVFQMIHTFKHYNGSGTGLRSLLDVYVYVWRRGESLDWDYIRRETEKLEIAEFEQQCRELAGKLFAEPDADYERKLSGEEMEMLCYFTGAGTYGTAVNRIKKKLDELQADGAPITRKTRIMYCVRRVFPTMDWIGKNMPFCYRHKWTIPFYLLYRILRGVLFDRKRLRGEVRNVRIAGTD